MYWRRVKRNIASTPKFVVAAAMLLAALVALPHTKPARAQATTPATQTVAVDLNAPTTPLPHFWEQMFGSGRASLALRAAYRRDLRMVKSITGFDYIRFHGIFDRDVGLYETGSSGQPVYNFSYVDQIYDGLLQNHVRPFVELSFMPPALAAPPIVHQAFWYQPVVSPPRNWEAWGDMIRRFASHLVQRYGIDEVSEWYFEVWNEPNLDFWAGDPKQCTYFQMYDTTARAIKSVSPRLRVGGPSTAQAAWVPDFLKHAATEHVPVDFVSTHVYGNDPPDSVLGVAGPIPRDQMVCRAVKKVYGQVHASPFPSLPIIFSEYNASYKNEPDVTDSVYMGPWLADTIRQCDGMVQILSYWTFSDVFEEQGVIRSPFYGGFGLVAEGGVPKPVFNAFRLLHRLGDRRISVRSDSVLATRHPDGTIDIAVWNYAPPAEAGAPRTIALELKGLARDRKAWLSQVDRKHGDATAAWRAMGSPASPTQAQYAELRQAAQLGPAQPLQLRDGRLTLQLPPKALFLVEIR